MSCPREGAQKGVGGESWGEETVARKRKREVEWEGHEERGEERAQRCPHWARGWKAQLWCLSAASSSHNSCAISRCPQPCTSVWGGHPLSTTTIAAAPSAAVSFLIFLPASDRAEGGDGKQLPCPATSLLPEAGAPQRGGEEPRLADREAGFHPVL